jgi:hypothetical protein
MENNQKYLNELFQLLCETYLYLKNNDPVPTEKEPFLNGFMTAGRCLQVSTEEMETVIDEANMKIFGMDYKTRAEIYGRTKENSNKVFDIPTFIRKKKRTGI